MAEKNLNYFTSASNLGLGCEPTWAWCSANTLFKNFTKWQAGEPNSPRTTRCGQLILNTDLNAVGLDDYPCDGTRFYICEVLKTG
jgi:hypothetical protein